MTNWFVSCPKMEAYPSKWLISSCSLKLIMSTGKNLFGTSLSRHWSLWFFGGPSKISFLRMITYGREGSSQLLFVPISIVPMNLSIICFYLVLLCWKSGIGLGTSLAAFWIYLLCRIFSPFAFKRGLLKFRMWCWLLLLSQSLTSGLEGIPSILKVTTYLSRTSLWKLLQHFILWGLSHLEPCPNPLRILISSKDS